MILNFLPFYISLPVAGLIAAVALWKKAFTPAAAAAAVVMLTLSSLFAGWAALGLFVFSFALVSAAELVVKKKFGGAATRGVHAKEGRRDLIQVLVNGISATVCALLYSATGEYAFIFAFAAALAEGAADSLASDIGELSQKPPIDIIRLKRIPKGMSGGVSLVGSIAAALGAGAVTASLLLFARASLDFLWVFGAALAGVALDSVLGSLFQAKYRCAVCGMATEKTSHCGAPAERTGGRRLINNDIVNLAGSIFAAAAAALSIYYI